VYIEKEGSITLAMSPPPALQPFTPRCRAGLLTSAAEHPRHGIEGDGCDGDARRLASAASTASAIVAIVERQTRQA
jgi:hypothetical protein